MTSANMYRNAALDMALRFYEGSKEEISVDKLLKTAEKLYQFMVKDDG